VDLAPLHAKIGQLALENDFLESRANQVWALDTTYIPMARGFVYLTAVVDVASRRVLAHKVAITLEACHAREVLEQAFARFGVPEIVNTDQGSQFTDQRPDLSGPT
jgi:putative transposase